MSVCAHPDAEAEQVLAAYTAATGAVIASSGTSAAYIPATDTICLASRAASHSRLGYVATLSHGFLH